MLIEIALENFKPFGTRQVAPLAPITLIYGPNSGGKSSLIQALMLLKQSMTTSGDSTGLIPRGEYVDLGSFKSLLHKHETTRNLYLSLRYDRVATPHYGGPRPSSDQRRQVATTFKLAKSPGSRRKDSSQLTDVEYLLDGEPDLRAHLVRREDQSANLTGPVFSWADSSSAQSLARCYLELQKRQQSRIKERNAGLQYDEDPESARDACFPPHAAQAGRRGRALGRGTGLG
jgi:hypothetical protein